MKRFGEIINNIEYKKRPGAYGLIVNPGNEIAICKTKIYNLPGGGQEPGETFEETLNREILEETGYQVDIRDKIGVAEFYFYSTQLDEYIYKEEHFYTAVLNKKIKEPIEKDHKLVWVKTDDAVRNLVDKAQAWAVRYLKST